MIPLLILGYRSVTLTVLALIFTVVSGLLNVIFCLTKLKMPFSFRHYDFKLMRGNGGLHHLCIHRHRGG